MGLCRLVPCHHGATPCRGQYHAGASHGGSAACLVLGTGEDGSGSAWSGASASGGVPAGGRMMEDHPAPAPAPPWALARMPAVQCLGTVSLCAAADGGCPDTCARCVTGVWGPLCAPLSWALCPWQGPPSAAPRGGLTAAPRAPAQGHAWLGQEGTPGHTLPWAAAHVLPTLGGAAEAPSSSSLPPGAPTPLLTHCGRGGQPPPCHPPLHSWVPRAVLA